MFARLQQFLIGKPLPTHEIPRQTIGKFVGLAVFASDALSSVAYATEEILLILATAGTIYFGLSIPIAIAIATLLVILTVSYRQTIFAYPNGGGAYIVARDNLGEAPAQIAGAALMTDYILTVSVSIASGVAQIASAFPALHPWRVELAVAMIVFMAIVNLRGVRESGTFFAIPTYFFISMMALTIGTGFWQLATGRLGQVTGIPPAAMMVQPLTLFLLLRAFSSGSVAVTGTEAISNGITAFREPKSRNAAATMAWMAGLLGTMFISITVLAHRIGAVPVENETVISQLARTVYGPGAAYLLTLAATMIILIMAANTSFADFPRVARLQASDGFLPRQLTLLGSRLVFSRGITALAILSSLLIVIFNANVSRLIPLYAIGVFLSFTMSQIGMVLRWRKVSRLQRGEEIQTRGSVLRPDPKWRLKQGINTVGATVTFIVMMVLAITKFSQGAWIVVIVIPTMVAIFFAIHHHYQTVRRQLSLENGPEPIPPEKTVVILIGGVHQGTMKAIQFVKTLNPSRVIAVHVALDPDEADSIRKKWSQHVKGIKLDIIESPYRELIEPLVSYIDEIQKEHDSDTVIVAVPEFVPAKWWHHFLHHHTAGHIRDTLEHREDVIIVDVPYRLHDETHLTFWTFARATVIEAAKNVFRAIRWLLGLRMP